ncbi:MAG TPA: cupin domain-containing protein [Streptosporangiaceae bacterium]|jgi:quercetin dioxygenase-like cupin family protein
MAPAGHVISNPLSGEHITIHATGGDVLAWELVLAPGGRVPGSHSHPEQRESFTVIEGRLRMRVGRRRVLALPGDTVAIPPGTVHHFANPGPGPARVAVETRPPLDTAALLETAAAMAREQQAAARLLPRPTDLALFMRDFEREVSAPYLPAPLVRLVTAAITRLARRRGHDARYRALRESPGASHS